MGIFSFMNNNEFEMYIKKAKEFYNYNEFSFNIKSLYCAYREEIFIEYHNHEFNWSEEKQSEFIELILLELPIPRIITIGSFLTLPSNNPTIIDGIAKIKTIVNFFNNDLILKDLKGLPLLNRLKYKDFPETMQTTIDTKKLSFIMFRENMDIADDIFERWNDI